MDHALEFSIDSQDGHGLAWSEWVWNLGDHSSYTSNDLWVVFRINLNSDLERLGLFVLFFPSPVPPLHFLPSQPRCWKELHWWGWCNCVHPNIQSIDVPNLWNSKETLTSAVMGTNSRLALLAPSQLSFFPVILMMLRLVDRPSLFTSSWPPFSTALS